MSNNNKEKAMSDNVLRITKENRAEYEGKEVRFEGSIEIAANLGTVSFLSLIATGFINALSGSGIEAGLGIKAGWGIEAGLGIKAKFISVKLRIFAGMISWRLPTPEETEIRAEILSGIVALGTVVKPEPK